MKQLLVCLFISFSLQVSLHAQTKHSFPPIDWKSLSPNASVEIVSSVIIEKVDFDNQDILDCLQTLSHMTYDALGRGFTITAQYAPDYPRDSQLRINQKFRYMTIREIIKVLAAASGAKIDMTEYGCRVSYGNVVWKNEPTIKGSQ